MTRKVVRQIYYAFIYSSIDYGIEVYSSCSVTHTNRLQVIQNELLKLILKPDRLTATNTRHRGIGLSKVTHIGKSSLQGFINKVNVAAALKFSFPTTKQKEMHMKYKQRVILGSTPKGQQKVYASN